MLDIGSVTASVYTRKALSAHMVSSLRKIGVFPGPVRIVLMAYATTAKAASPKIGCHVGDWS
jgi:hypothetical protein